MSPLRGTPKSRAVPWLRLLGEAVLIVLSVYLGIALEGIFAERERRAEAVAALSALRAELELDHADAVEILGLQAAQIESNGRIRRWLTAPAAAPVDSLGAALLHVLTDNRTMFPRKSSWTTMVSEAQLSVLGDPRLVRGLANFYEHSNVRLEYNGDRYDDTTQDMLRVRMPAVWDVGEQRFLTTDEAALRTFASQMIQVQRQSEGYSDLLTAWKSELEDVMAQVDGFLGHSGGGA